MPLWGSNDDAANSTISTPAQFGVAPDTGARANLFSNVTADAWVTGATVGVFGVDVNEQLASVGQAEHAAHAGWNLRTEGSGGRAGRVTYETLVAMKSMTGDAEDVVFPDLTIFIFSQPQDDSSNTGDPVSFSVGAYTAPAGGTLTYQWQGDGGVGSFGNLSDAGVYSNTTNATLTISDNTGLDANVYRVIISATGADTVTSANATLTEVV